ncbi:beta-galactosidase [Pedobacter hartonius]|uniref:Beta-galactosidase n=1 Tax=Pedobacter hartonius TaxID=425514 RepID=A0A1H4G6W6_9SPHI|nr:beta-galactosidase [Pedobacter hartonius]
MLTGSLLRTGGRLLFLLVYVMPSAAYSQALTDDPAVINDHMFPALAAAKPFSDFDSKGFLIHGKRTFLVSAGLEYARLPHELWHDRLLQLKRGGFNCVEIYTIWNFHEPKEGQFEFNGDHDLNAFLALVKQMGMYAIVRVGPYYCAEWDQGGYPIWLRFKEGLRVREDNAVFERYVDRFFDLLLPIVFKHQINHGGSVVMVQLENEHPKGWGTIMPDNYFRHLQSKALSLGLAVPYMFSGVHHSTDPAGEAKLDNVTRPNPWFSTEYWSMWYTQYGAKKGDAARYDRSTWKIIAHGGNGYNVYMAYGGSNFGYTNNDEDAASYDYGAAVGQAGDLRPIYFTFKRAAFFARSFQEVLENSTDAGGKYQHLLADKGVKHPDTAVRLTARTSPAGDLVFLDNPAHKMATAVIKPDKTTPALQIKLSPGEIRPLVHNVRLNSSVSLDWALTRVYGMLKQGHTTTLLLEAAAGEKVFLSFLLKEMAAGISGQTVPVVGKRLAVGTGPVAAGKQLRVTGKEFTVSGNRISLHAQAKAGTQPTEYSFTTGQEQVRILVMERSGTDQTWLTEMPSLNGIVTGVPYLGKVEVKHGKITASAESSLNTRHTDVARIYLEKGSQSLTTIQTATENLQEFPDKANQPVSAKQLSVNLSAWEYKNAALSASPDFDDSKWLHSETPLQMGADNDITADAWYRTRLSVAEPGRYSMQAEGGDRGTIFIDGKPAAQWKIKTGEVALDLTKGQHIMAIFTAHDGRDKMAAYLGPIENIDKKGLSGIVKLKKGGPFYHTLENWYFTKAAGAGSLKDSVPLLDTLQWKKYKIGADAFDLKEGFGWFATVIPAQRGLSKMIIAFKSVDENATVFINGKEMIRRDGWNIPFEFCVTDAEVLSKPMVLTVFVENHDKEGGIDQAVKINTIGNGMILSGWKMRGGPDEGKPDEGAAWQKLPRSVMDTVCGPQYFRSSFTLPRLKGKLLIWRLNPEGMGHGSVWLNGHHIGRYPELNGKVGMYIPEPWLKPGENELLIYEEEGKYPQSVNISSEQAAGRILYQLRSK